MKSKRFKKLPEKTSDLPSEMIEKLLPVVKKNCTTKFDESLDISFQINNKQKKSEINIRTVVNLPGGTGKKVKVAVVCEDVKSSEAKTAGADIVGFDDLAAEMYEATNNIMTGAGMPAYEISNHAATGEACRHNLVYWRAQDWIGIGPGAHGRLTVPGGRLGLANRRSPAAWLDSVEADGHAIDIVTKDDHNATIAECLMMGMRLADGVPLVAMDTRFGPRASWLEPPFGPSVGGARSVVVHGAGFRNDTGSLLCLVVDATTDTTACYAGSFLSASAVACTVSPPAGLAAYADEDDDQVRMWGCV